MNFYGEHLIEEINTLFKNLNYEIIFKNYLKFGKYCLKKHTKSKKTSCLYINPINAMCGSLLISELWHTNKDKELFKALDILVQLCGYSQVICYWSTADNGGSKKWLEELGFKVISEINNLRTNNQVFLMEKQYTYPVDQDIDDYLDDHFESVRQILLEKETT